MPGISALGRGTAGTSDDQFLFEDRQSKEEPTNDLFSSLDPETAKQKKSMVGGLATMLAYLAFDLMWGSWEGTPGAKNFGSSLDGYVPHMPAYVPIAFLAAFIALLVLLRRRTRGMPLASLWVHGRTFMLVPSNKKKLSFDLDTTRIGTVTVREKAFNSGKLEMLVEDAAGKRHSISQLSDTSDVIPFSEYCRRFGVRFARERESRAGQIAIAVLMVVPALMLVCALDHEHPVQGVVKIIGAALIGLWVPWVLGEKKE
jgi:hypothetical protein